ncbi:MAG TPA: phage tail sheath subtilisin-like domain-containing protein [Fibrobacteria bacterium]|nr:phage tail sheath subtilisin-like domain-containing protein [Fibrobacteria bacterium]
MSLDTLTIPPDILKPGVYAELNAYAGSSGLPANTQKLLLIGQRLAAGTVAQAVVQQVFTEAEAATYFGAGSIAHLMVVQALAVSRNLPLFVVALDDAAASAAATATLTLTGTATAAGTLTMWIGSERIDVGVLSGDDPTALATRARATINAIPSLPVAATGTVGAIILTAKNKGAVGNQLVLRAVVTATAVTLSATKVPFAGGATDPNLQTALDAAFPSQFHVIAIQSTVQADILKLKTHLDSASSALEMREGRGFAPASPTDVLASVATVATAINHERVSIVYARGSYSTGFELAATVAARVAEESHPARPFNGLTLPGIAIPDVPDRFTRSEQETLLKAGVAPIEVTGQDCAIVRLVTTRTSISGVSDLTLIDTTTIASLDYLRYAWRSRMRLKFARAFLDDDTLRSIIEQTVDVMLLMQEAKILQKVSDYKDRVVSARDPNYPGRARVQVPAPVVPGLHQIFARFDLITL